LDKQPLESGNKISENKSIFSHNEKVKINYQLENKSNINYFLLKKGRNQYLNNIKNARRHTQGRIRNNYRIFILKFQINP
jgi:hypothetical protein